MTHARTDDTPTPEQAPDHTYDVVVVGAGPVGENVADRARAAGLSAAIVESELVGGECSYWACMPSKALLRPVLAQADARGLPGLERMTAGPLDTRAVLDRRDGFASDWKDDGQVEWVDSTGTDLYRGHGRLAGERRVTVTGADGQVTTLAARHAVALCTGTRAASPTCPAWPAPAPWT
ncbi:FAD-dependent oxidoreductase, partial [Streptomyces albidoflavus]|nr:FAD-dependent oxidoreductase [Streptomyces albidoflavus]